VLLLCGRRELFFLEYYYIKYDKYLIDRLIDYCLTSSKQYFRYIQNVNKFNIYTKEGRNASIGSTTFDWH